MSKSIKVTKKTRGRPATGKGKQVGERWHDAELAAIDKWIAAQGEQMTRGQAIRRLVEIGLKAGGGSKLAQKTERHSQDEKTGKRAK